MKAANRNCISLHHVRLRWRIAGRVNESMPSNLLSTSPSLLVSCVSSWFLSFNQSKPYLPKLLTRMLFHFLLLFLPFTLASPTDGDSTKILCHHESRTNLDTTDCTQLVDRLSTLTWYSHLVTYGQTQSAPGSTPILINYQSCQLEIRSRSGRRLDSENLRLSDYAGDLLEVIEKCMGPGKGGKITFNAGLLPLGSENKFYALLSGKRTPRNRGNATVGRLDDTDTGQHLTVITLT